MAINITEADNYIELNVIDVDDWVDSDDARKQRILNVAERELTNQYEDYVIPDEAVYEFAAVLSVVFNDTNKNKQYGVSNFQIQGIAFTFNGGKDSITSLIPRSAKDLIGKENGVKLTGLRWTVL